MKARKQSNRPTYATPALALLGVWLGLSLAGCGGPEPSQPQAGEAVRGLRIHTVSWETVPDEIEAPGTIVAAATAQVAARAMGTVTQVAVREGDRVKRGQLLVLLDERELAARRSAARAALEEAAAAREEAARGVAAAQAQAELAGKTYERFAYLREHRSVSPQEFDEVEAKQRAAQAALAQAKARQQQVEAMHTRAESESRAAEAVASYARVVAPFDGVVVRRTVDPGSMISPGMPLLVVEDTSRYQMEVSVPVEDAMPGAKGRTVLRRGSAARVRLDALPGAELTGKVVEVEAGADPTSHTVRVRIELPRNPAMRSGLFGRAWFGRGERRALVIPSNAVVERGQLRGVFVVNGEQMARWRLVVLGQTFAGRVEILSGLGESERIVFEPGTLELDGRKILASAGKEAGR